MENSRDLQIFPTKLLMSSYRNIKTNHSIFQFYESSIHLDYLFPSKVAFQDQVKECVVLLLRHNYLTEWVASSVFLKIHVQKALKTNNLNECLIIIQDQKLSSLVERDNFYQPIPVLLRLSGALPEDGNTSLL